MWAGHCPDMTLGLLGLTYRERKLEYMGLIEKKFTEISVTFISLTL